ncbi:MAG: hypothetical protein GY909_13770 [Oligoflexia bacterium]|nr:hypothetical protein [Oligoflexia bacterium]
MNKLKKIISSDISVVIGLLIVIGVISSLDGQYSLLSHKANPHPLLILSVIFAAYRGLRFALVSSVLINILYFSILFITIDSDAVLTYVTVEYLKTPVLIFFISIIVGEFKQRTIDRNNKLKHDIDGRESVLKLSRDELKLLNEEIKSLRKKLIFKKDSLNILMDIDRNLSVRSTEDVLKNFISLLHEHFYVEKAAAWIELKSGELFLVDDHNTIESGKNSAIFGDVLYGDSSFNVIDAKNLLDDSYRDPLLAGVLDIGRYGKFCFIVNKIPFLHFSKQNIEAIEMLASWAQRHLERLYELKDLSQNLDIDPEFDILKRKSFLSQFENNIEQATVFERDLSLIKITFNSLGELARDDFKKILSVKAKELMRGMDIIGEGEKKSQIVICYIGSMDEANKFCESLRSSLEDIMQLDIDNDAINFYILNPFKDNFV